MVSQSGVCSLWWRATRDWQALLGFVNRTIILAFQRKSTGPPSFAVSGITLFASVFDLSREKRLGIRHIRVVNGRSSAATHSHTCIQKISVTAVFRALGREIVFAHILRVCRISWLALVRKSVREEKIILGDWFGVL
jgi:hypothetical protein